MSIRIVRLGSPRQEHEGLRIGTVRRPPRGVKKSDYASKNYFDVWLPVLSPQPATIKLVMGGSPKENWAKFVQQYRREMALPDAERTLLLLAALSHQTDFSVGCYCERAEHCHRTILGELLREAGAVLTPQE